MRSLISLFSDRSISDNDKRRIAYALNLCSVSVSQIIDYKDFNILEQEYDAILNNLNLNEMPNDEEFHDILRQLLDTITFFKMQEGDKKFVEKEYQLKLKNAIWSTVPSLGSSLVTASAMGASLNVGNIIGAAFSLVFQLGSCYMNYRKNKAQIEQEHEKELWQLERSAIEQFNILQRSLFTATWKIAGKYYFPDEYRLTEKQIKQYDDILIDTNLQRKFERLDAIKDSFEAYPPFWYNLANTASVLAFDIKDQIIEDDNEVNYYLGLAREYYEKFDTIYVPLMREDIFAASAKIEYAALLSEKEEKEEKDKIITLLNDAKKLSGNNFDIKQFCAFGYMKINESKHAIPIFRQLVNEDYNKNLNAQLLSYIYVDNYLQSTEDKEKTDIRNEYNRLALSVNERYLYPLPEDISNEEIENLTTSFIESQREILKEKKSKVLDKYKEKYTIIFYKILPTINLNNTYDDSYYLDCYNENCKSDLKHVLSKKKLREDLITRLLGSDLIYEWLDVCNRILLSLKLLEPYISIEDCKNKIRSSLNEMQDKIQDIEKILENESSAINNKDIEEVFDIHFDLFTNDLFNFLSDELDKKISDFKDLNECSQFESILRNFCNKENLPEPEVIFEDFGTNKNLVSKDNLLSISVFGEKFEETKKEKNIEKEICNLIESNSKDILCDSKNCSFKFKYKNEKDEYEKSFDTPYLKEYFREAIAIYRDSSVKYSLIFTRTNIIYPARKISIDYNQLYYYPEKNACMFDKYKYKNKNINIEKFYELIKEIKNLIG